MRTDRQTDMAKLIVAFKNFANASKNNSFEMSFNVFQGKCLIFVKKIV